MNPGCWFAITDHGSFLPTFDFFLLVIITSISLGEWLNKKRKHLELQNFIGFSFSWFFQVDSVNRG